MLKGSKQGKINLSFIFLKQDLMASWAMFLLLHGGSITRATSGRKEGRINLEDPPLKIMSHNIIDFLSSSASTSS